MLSSARNCLQTNVSVIMNRSIFCLCGRWNIRRDNLYWRQSRNIHASYLQLCDSKEKPSKLVPHDYFRLIEEKNKKTFLMSINYFYEKSAHRRGHVDFIRSALKYMEEFNVEKELEAYKSLLDVLPKGKFVPQNIIQQEFLHYPRQTDIAIELLDKMESNAIIPDEEMEQMLVNIFGNWGHPVRKMRRMLYWMSKFRHLSPWPLPLPLPNDNLELAILALKRITSIDLQTKVEVLEASELIDSVDDTWIVSAQSLPQQQLLARHPTDQPVFIEGPFLIWLRSVSIAYFMMRSERDAYPILEENDEDPDDVSNIRIPFYSTPDEKKESKKLRTQESVHMQDDGVFLGFCATGSSSRDSLLSWVRFLEKTNPKLAELSVVFKQKSPVAGVIPVEEEKTENNQCETKEKIVDENR